MHPFIRQSLAFSAMLGFFVLHAAGQETDPREVLRKSIEAHGGEKLLAKTKASTSKFKGKLEVQNMSLDITGDSAYKFPSKFRNALTFEIKGMPISIVQVFNGETFWVSVNGKTREVKDEKLLKVVREQLASEKLGNLAPLLTDKDVKIVAIGEIKVKETPAVGVRVSKKDVPDINMFFDKKTNLLLKSEMRTTDPATGKEITQEKYFMDYKRREGIQMPNRMVIEQDGRPFMDVEVTAIELLEDVADTNFQMP